jgi:magnesium chelatase subunit H
MPVEPEAGRGGADAPGREVPLNLVLITMDNHLGGAVARAQAKLRADWPGMTLKLHAAADWSRDPAALERCREDIATGDLIVSTMIFMEDQIKAIEPALAARQPHCDAMVGCFSAGEVVRLTRLGAFRMNGSQTGIVALLKRMRGGGGKAKAGGAAGAGAKQMAMLRRLPKILRFIPGPAQDMRAYFLTMQYFLSGSAENIEGMARLLVGRYASGARVHLHGAKAEPPALYPETGVYHPTIPGRIATDASVLPRRGDAKGTVGVLVMRSYVLAGDTAHYDAVIAALEAKGLDVVCAFAAGLDARPAADLFFKGGDGRPCIDMLVSLTGFSLVGGPAYSEPGAAEAMMVALDVPCLAAHALEFQTLEEWRASDQGLTPVESTLMVALPELDGAISPMVYGGRSASSLAGGGRAMEGEPERIARLSGRVAAQIGLRRKANADKSLAIVLFNFPPNAGDTGTAAYLDVFASLHTTLQALAADGYDVVVQASVEALRAAVVGEAVYAGLHAQIAARIPAHDHVRREPHLAEIEAQWGPAPGRQQALGGDIAVLGAQFGKVFVGVQPAFGYEGDPMRLLFEKGFAPTHAFSAFYRYIREDIAADAVLHFGTHGALEFMPGKQVGLSGADWPDRLIGDLPNVYLYAANNPSEGLLARRRSGAVLVSHLTPPVTHAGLYKGLAEVKASLERLRGLAPDDADARASIAELLQTQAAALDLAPAEPAWTDVGAEAAALQVAVAELEETLIPFGLHVAGQAPDLDARIELLACMAEADGGEALPRETIVAIAKGLSPSALPGEEADAAHVARLKRLAAAAAALAHPGEMDGLLRALSGRYVRPAPGGDILRTPEALPTGRNIHGFDPYRIPSATAVHDGVRQAERLLERHSLDGGGVAQSIAMVLWGSDNLKSQGAGVAQALHLMGARARFDAYGRLCGAELIPLAELGRPRTDVVMSLSGIFRDLLPNQVRLLAEAARLAADADEPVELNFVRKHALARQAETGCDAETAALRVFSNAEGAYGANVNNLIQSGMWEQEDELAEAYTRRKGHAFTADGKVRSESKLFQALLGEVSLTYQNLESTELGVTTIDHYFDSLGGMARAVTRAKGEGVTAYIGDDTTGKAKVRTLAEQVALETRTRALNPKWFEALLAHGHEGVREIEHHVTNTFGWSATTGQVAPWVYQGLSETYVLDDVMRERLAALNPGAADRLAHRLLEACDRNYWTPDADTLARLRAASDDLEDRLEGISPAFKEAAE